MMSSANPDPAFLSALDDWYRKAFENCGSDEDCKRIMKTAYENRVACARGTKACSDQDSDSIAIERWNAQKRSQTSSSSTLMGCLQDTADRVVANCKQRAAAKNVPVEVECPDGMGIIRVAQQARCGYSAIEPDRPITLESPRLPIPPPNLREPQRQPREPQVDPICLSNLQVEGVPEGQARAMCTH
jgi:hypothetical protein